MTSLYTSKISPSGRWSVTTALNCRQRFLLSISIRNTIKSNFNTGIAGIHFSLRTTACVCLWEWRSRRKRHDGFLESRIHHHFLCTGCLLSFAMDEYRSVKVPSRLHHKSTVLFVTTLWKRYECHFENIRSLLKIVYKHGIVSLLVCLKLSEITANAEMWLEHCPTQAGIWFRWSLYSCFERVIPNFVRVDFTFNIKLINRKLK